MYFDGESCVITFHTLEVVVYPDGKNRIRQQGRRSFMIADTEEELQKELDRFRGDPQRRFRCASEKVVIVDDIAWENVSA